MQASLTAFGRPHRARHGRRGPERTAPASVRLAAATFALSLLNLTVCAQAQAQATITGAGPGFAAPLDRSRAEDPARATGIDIDFQAIGSPAGIGRIDDQAVDSDAADPPLPSTNPLKNDLLLLPTATGGVTIAIDLRGVRPGRP